MQHKDLDAPEELNNQVQGFWYISKDFGPSASSFEVLPDGHAELIFHFGSGCSILHEGVLQALPSPFIVGLLGQPVHFYAQDRLQIIGIKCLPWAIYDLLQIPAVKGGIQSLAHPIAMLQNNLQAFLDVGKVAEALQLVCRWLVNSRSQPAISSVLNKAGQALLQASGNLPVSSVAAAAHATVRTLERKFKASSGHTVKDVAGLIRFEQARDRLWGAPDSAITALAHELGYADQSHLNREFKRYCGLTAAAFARQMKARRKDLDDNFVAIVLSS